MEMEIQDVPKEVGDVENVLVTLDLTDVFFAQITKDAEAAVISGPDDKVGYEQMKKDRFKLVKTRTGFEKVVDQKMEEVLAKVAKGKALKKTTMERISAIEKIYADKEAKYEAEVAKIAAERTRLEQIRVDGLLAQLQELEWTGNQYHVAQMKPDEFEALLSSERERFRLVLIGRQAEADRQAAEKKAAEELAEKNRLEADRLKKIADDQELERLAVEKKNRDERERLEADQAEFQRQKKAFEDQQAQALRDLEQKRVIVHGETNSVVQPQPLFEEGPSTDYSDASSRDREALRIIEHSIRCEIEGFDERGLETDGARHAFIRASDLFEAALQALLSL